MSITIQAMIDASLDKANALDNKLHELSIIPSDDLGYEIYALGRERYIEQQVLELSISLHAKVTETFDTEEIVSYLIQYCQPSAFDLDHYNSDYEVLAEECLNSLSKCLKVYVTKLIKECFE